MLVSIFILPFSSYFLPCAPFNQQSQEYFRICAFSDTVLGVWGRKGDGKGPSVFPECFISFRDQAQCGSLLFQVPETSCCSDSTVDSCPVGVERHCPVG